MASEVKDPMRRVVVAGIVAAVVLALVVRYLVAFRAFLPGYRGAVGFKNRSDVVIASARLTGFGDVVESRSLARNGHSFSYVKRSPLPVDVAITWRTVLDVAERTARVSLADVPADLKDGELFFVYSRGGSWTVEWAPVLRSDVLQGEAGGDGAGGGMDEALDASTEAFIGELLHVQPDHGVGWTKSTPSGAGYSHASIRAPAPFRLRLSRLWRFEDTQRRGGVGQVETPGHQFDGMWVTFSTRHVGHFNFTDRRPTCNLDLSPDEPIGSKQGWPVAPENRSPLVAYYHGWGEVGVVK